MQGSGEDWVEGGEGGEDEVWGEVGEEEIWEDGEEEESLGRPSTMGYCMSKLEETGLPPDLYQLGIQTSDLKQLKNEEESS